MLTKNYRNLVDTQTSGKIILSLQQATINKSCTTTLAHNQNNTNHKTNSDMGVQNAANKARRRKKQKDIAAARYAQQKHHDETTTRVLAFYDKVDGENTDHLTQKQVGQLLQLMNEDDGEPPLDDITLESAISFVMRHADEDKSGGIDKHELTKAVAAWNNWAMTHDALGEKVKTLLKEIDKDMSGTLDREELKNLLVKLNEGNEVPEKHIEKIIQKCNKRGDGVIHIEELGPSLTLWYSMTDHDEMKSNYAVSEGGDEGDGEEKLLGEDGTNTNEAGACCIIS